MTPQDSFIVNAWLAAQAAGHIFPEYAACEASLESVWGSSGLAKSANNLFGRKQSHTNPVYDTLDLPTREYLHGEWVTVMAHWVKYPDWQSCFIDRMKVLQRLPSLYGEALKASTGEDFVRLVSAHWSTDPARADKVLSIYDHHKGVFQNN